MIRILNISYLLMLITNISWCISNNVVVKSDTIQITLEELIYTKEYIKNTAEQMSLQELLDLRNEIFKSTSKDTKVEKYISHHATAILITGLYHKEIEELKRTLDISQYMFYEHANKRGLNKKYEPDEINFYNKFITFKYLVDYSLTLSIDENNNTLFWHIVNENINSNSVSIRNTIVYKINSLADKILKNRIDNQKLKTLLIKRKIQENNLLNTETFSGDFMNSEVYSSSITDHIDEILEKLK